MPRIPPTSPRAAIIRARRFLDSLEALTAEQWYQVLHRLPIGQRAGATTVVHSHLRHGGDGTHSPFQTFLETEAQPRLRALRYGLALRQVDAMRAKSATELLEAAADALQAILVARQAPVLIGNTKMSPAPAALLLYEPFALVIPTTSLEPTV